MGGVRGGYLPAVGLALALLAAGCGSGGGGAETLPRMTKGQFVHRLGVVCQEHTDRQVVAIENFDKKHGFPGGPAHEKASRAQLEKELVIVILPIVRDTIHDVGELRPPRNQEATLKDFVAALEHGVSVSEKNPSWVATLSFEPFHRARLLSVKLGTALCGQA